MVYEIRLMHQVMFLSPSIEEARQNLLQQLFSWEAIITTQSRISSTRYQVSKFFLVNFRYYIWFFQVGLDRSSAPATYRNLLAKLPAGQIALNDVYTAVENRVNNVKAYVGVSLFFKLSESRIYNITFFRNGSVIKRFGICNRRACTSASARICRSG